MTKEELLKRLHEILEIVGPDRAFEISENTNERKTLWIHQTPGEDEYLMLSATKLFPISTIRNIVYEYGEDIGSYSDTDFILCFELNGDCDYTVEFGGGFENGTYVIYYDGNRWHATEEDTDWLKKYNERMRVKESMSRLIWTAAEFSKEANAEELLEVKNKAVSYFDEYPEDHELLLTYTYLALCMLYNEEEDHFDARWAIQLIAKRKLKEKLLQHIEQYTYYDGTERNVFVIHTEPAVVRVPVARQAVVDFLQTQGCLQSALVYGKLEISGMTPEIPALLQKFGNALEGGVFANLQGNTRFSDEKISYEYKWGSGTLNELDVVAVMDKEKLVLISCKACRQLEIAFVDEIAIRAASLHVGAIPVLVCSELQPGDKKAFRDRCRSQGVLLVDAADMGKAAEKICCAAESEA